MGCRFKFKNYSVQYLTQSSTVLDQTAETFSAPTAPPTAFSKPFEAVAAAPWSRGIGNRVEDSQWGTSVGVQVWHHTFVAPVSPCCPSLSMFMCRSMAVSLETSVISCHPGQQPDLWLAVYP